MRSVNPTKKRSGLVHANYYGLVDTQMGKEVKCLGKQWMTREQAADEVQMRDNYRDYQNMKACNMDVPPEMEAVQYGEPIITMEKLRIPAMALLSLILLSIALSTCNA